MIELSFYVEAKLLKQHKLTSKCLILSPTNNFDLNYWVRKCLNQKLTELPCPLNLTFVEIDDINRFKTINDGSLVDFCEFTIFFDSPDYSEIRFSDIKTELLDKYVKSLYKCLDKVELDPNLYNLTEGPTQHEVLNKLRKHTYTFYLLNESIYQSRISMFA